MNADFDNDLELAIDILGGKIIAYAHYKEDFSDARKDAYEAGLPGIKDCDDILHYLNWETPRLHLIDPKFDTGVYAGDNNWNRKVRSIYSDFAFSGAAAKYTEYALSLESSLFLDLADKYGIDIAEVDFKAVPEGQTSTGEAKGEYVPIGVTR